MCVTREQHNVAATRDGSSGGEQETNTQVNENALLPVSYQWSTVRKQNTPVSGQVMQDMKGKRSLQM
jgi:hypothetical protein